MARFQAVQFLGVRIITLILIVGAASALAGVHSFPSLSFMLHDISGLILILATKVFDYRCVEEFSAAGGTFLFTSPPRKVVDSGPYAHVRNPLYLTLFIDTIGLLLIFGSLTYLILLVLLIIGIHIIVVTREEPRLASRFGRAYLHYRASVPRWIPRSRLASRPAPISSAAAIPGTGDSRRKHLIILSTTLAPQHCV